MHGTIDRDREATETKLVAAVEKVIARDGFGAVGVNAVARTAGVDKVLIYRYFGGLEGLLAVYAEKGEFWSRPEDILAEPLPKRRDRDGLSLALAVVFERYVAFLRSHPVALEVIAWEMSERNALTVALEAVRTTRGFAVMRALATRYGVDEAALMPEIAPMFALLGAAANYLAARGRRLPRFNGVDLQSDEGWTQLHRAARQMIAGVVLPHPRIGSKQRATAR